MKYIPVTIFLLFSCAVLAQQRSYLYNEKGQLNSDTTLTITKAQYNTWSQAEFNLLAGFSQIKFPIIYLENGVKAKGVLIASFLCDTSDIKDVTIIKDSSGYPGYAQSVVQGLQEQGKSIAERLKKKARYISTDALYMGIYYVSFDFMLIDFYEQLRDRKAVPIIRGSIPAIDVGLH
jgi:hypothetical protein